MPKSPRTLLALAAASLFVGCGKKDAAPAGPVTVNAEAVTRLVAADAVDGKTDKVVAKCGGCSLHMDGKPNLALKVQDYEMHFCSQHCLDRFTAAPEKEILAMKLPK